MRVQVGTVLPLLPLPLPLPLPLRMQRGETMIASPAVFWGRVGGHFSVPTTNIKRRLYITCT